MVGLNYNEYNGFHLHNNPHSSYSLGFGWISILAFMIPLVGLPGLAQSRFYNPLPFPPSGNVVDTLSNQDIPTGLGSFARDYQVTLQKGEQVSIELTSTQFDTILTLLTPDGSTFAENDDGPNGSSNSLLLTRIHESGSHIIRVQAFGRSPGGSFTLTLTKLRSI